MVSSPYCAALPSVLLVDDSASQRAHAAHLCRELGVAEVFESDGGEQALNLLAALRPIPPVTILDIEMPGMDGIEFIEALRARNISTALIVASGRESSMIDSVLAVGTSLGFEVLGGLEKPISLRSLAALLSSLHARFHVAPVAEIPTYPAVSPYALEAALNNLEIIPYYQPKVEIATGRACGVEALARWRHPMLGPIATTHFIHLAEQYGLMKLLTMSILEQALAHSVQWRRAGLFLPVAVNLSPKLLDWPGLADEIVARTRCYEVPFDQVIFELTESSVVTTDGVARGLLAKLRLRGFGLAIDDYGTGFSSMQQLARIPFTEVKIDRSFVRGAHERKGLRVILRTAVEMAKQLSLTSTAEGIETEDEWRLLQRLGCTVGQGYFVARPMPGSDIPGWLRRHESRQGELGIAVMRQPLAGE